MNIPKESQEKSVKKLYRGAQVFITGASGFIGKVLVEKLLRSCPELDKVFVLLRPKKNHKLEERINQMTNSLLFENIKRENSSLLKKIQGIVGDAKEPRLGISDDDIEKLKSCTVIFHLAACVRFDDQLSDAIKLNTRGTREICELAKTIPTLKALVYVSTAYVQPKHLHIQESLYPPTCDWKYYKKYAESLDEDVLNCLTPKLTSFAPNTYSFTKFLAEHVCNDYRRENNLPIIIYRPSIVSVADSECSGFCDSFSGPTGLLLAYMTGIKRVLRSTHLLLDIIPVDICAKGMIVASAKDQTSEEIPVYNAASVLTITVAELFEAGKPLVENILIEKSIGLPSLTLVKYKWYEIFLTFWLQIVPAIIIDAVLILFKRKPIAMKYQRIIANVEKSLSFFSSNVFTFETDNFCKLVRNVCNEDQKEFNMKLMSDKFEYFRQGYAITKKILLNENEENEQVAKRRKPYWKTLTFLLKALMYTLLYKIVIYLLQYLHQHLH